VAVHSLVEAARNAHMRNEGEFRNPDRLCMPLRMRLVEDACGAVTNAFPQSTRGDLPPDGSAQFGAAFESRGRSDSRTYRARCYSIFFFKTTFPLASWCMTQTYHSFSMADYDFERMVQ